jgi:hypothetical protein
VSGFRHLARVLIAAAWIGVASSAVHAHDLERTRVSLTFASDGAFVLDVSNDANWLRLRLEDFAADYPALPPPPDRALTAAERDARLRAFAPAFSDRVVLWANHREARPESAEYIAPGAGDDPPLGTFRMRGRVPIESQSLHWYYGIVIDPYAMTVRRPDGRANTETVLGNAWSEPIDLAGQFRNPTRVETARARVRAAWVFLLRGPAWVITIVFAGVFAAAIVIGGVLHRH